MFLDAHILAMRDGFDGGNGGVDGGSTVSEINPETKEYLWSLPCCTYLNGTNYSTLSEQYGSITSYPSGALAGEHTKDGGCGAVSLVGGKTDNDSKVSQHVNFGAGGNGQGASLSGTGTAGLGGAGVLIVHYVV